MSSSLESASLVGDSGLFSFHCDCCVDELISFGNPYNFSSWKEAGVKRLLRLSND